MPTAAEWLQRGGCYYGHALYGPGDLRRLDSGKVECEACWQDMRVERANLRRAAGERAESGRG